MKILIIDDEDDIRGIARLSLAKVGKMDVVDARSGLEGLKKAVAEKPDVILLDVMMPGLDGPATLSALRTNEVTASIPVIFLTAKVMTAEVERLKDFGVKGVLTKPFDPMALPTEVLACLAKA
jgi:two-component system OmpR family response regulator